MSGDSGRRRRFRPGLVLWGALALVVLVLMAQNTDSTTVRLLGFRVEMPLFLLIASCLLLGWLLGTLGSWLLRRRESRRRDRERRADPDGSVAAETDPS